MTKVYKDRYSHFTHIKNDIYESDQHDDINTLTWKAMGIFGFMWHNPDNWEFYEDELASHSKDGKSALRSGIEELEKAGFIKRVQKRDKEGKFSSYDWILNEAPFLENRKSDKSKSDKRKSDNRKLLSTNDTKYLENQVLNEDEEEAFQNYKSAFESSSNPISSFMLKKIINLIKSVNPGVFNYAIDLAATGNAKSPYNFIKTLLDDWSKHKLNTLEQVKNYSDSFKKSKTKKGSLGRNKRKEFKEKLPDWANESEKDKNARRKKEKAEHDYKMEHDPSYREQQEKNDKEIEDNLKKIREMRKE